MDESSIEIGITEIKLILKKIGDNPDLQFNSYIFEIDSKYDRHLLIILSDGKTYQPISIANEWIRKCADNKVERQKMRDYLMNELELRIAKWFVV